MINNLDEQFESLRNDFLTEIGTLGIQKVVDSITGIVNKVGSRFLELDGGELSDAQIKLAGYKYYLSDVVSDFQRKAEYYSIEIKNIRATEWENVSGKIKTEKGKVSNKEQIENEILQITKESQIKKVLNENYHNNLKIKMSAMSEVITAITQRIAELKKQHEKQF